MGKIKIKTIGIEDEEELRQKDKEKREQKKMRKLASGGGKAEEKKEEKPVELQKEKKEEKEEAKIKKAKEKKKEKAASVQVKSHGRKYQQVLSLVDRKKTYKIDQAIELVKKTSFSKFVGTVEVHINLLEPGLKVSLILPFPTGKERKAVVCDEQVLTSLEAGKYDFDVLIATPDFMPRLARFAKILGPKGLMPNPKAGTVTATPDKVLKELKAGRVDLRTEVNAPIIHTIIGKADFEDKKLVENFQALINAIGKEKIRSVFVKATMGPGIRVLLE